MTTADPAAPVAVPTARVVLLTGPSGSGKSTLAERTGLPVLNLDDFYKAADDPTLPQLPHGAGPDWDSPLSWHADAAMAALETLARTGTARVPVYDIASSSITGDAVVGLGGVGLFVAEGIFAAELVARCEAAGLLGAAVCLRGRPVVTAWRRLRRDLREGRKSVPYLLRRGWRLMRAERGIVARQTALGATACDDGAALALITRAALTPSRRRPEAYAVR
ncbi:ATP-binding protein [Streptomyces sp. PTM05]|uniref:ATP-binding protein n=1 Tax=Streptantibioticus parmotrematis TaxID=2873249 RepID=A0ABS7QL98_9ACTN|nr:ATP-binding protein [Streptantibioticus parmotrematis]MBY8883961.1 ATP-binding protein [Streptantibioticus parmotrematis]